MSIPPSSRTRPCAGSSAWRAAWGQCAATAAGLAGDRLLGYAEARQQIYLPTYRRVLDHCLQNEIAELRQLGAGQMVVLLDDETNGDLDDLTSPLSHAALIARYIDETWPEH